MQLHDPIEWRCHTRLDKFYDDAHHGAWVLGKATPYETVEIDGNMLLNGGIALIWGVFIGTSGAAALSNSTARIGVSNDSTVAAATQTSLVPTSGSQHFRPMASGYPTRNEGVTPNTAQFQAAFPSGAAEFAWSSWGIDNGGPSAGNSVGTVLVNRKVEALGTKSAGAWTLTVTLSLS